MYGQPVVEITDGELDRLLASLGVPMDRRKRIYRLYFCVDGGLKVKINGDTWSPPMGKIQE